MNRYNEGKIYKLCNDVDDQIYVGSTCLSLAKRRYSHKQCTKRRTSPVYNHLNAIGWDHVHIILVESYPCANKMELEKRERYWIEKLNSSLNRYIPQRTHDECKKSHKIRNDKYKLSEKYKVYRQSEKYKDYRNEYRERVKQNQKYQKTLSFMESTIQKYRLVPPIEIINFQLV